MKNQMIRIFIINALCIVLCSMVCFSCKPSAKPVYTDTPTSGAIRIAVDDNYAPLISDQIDLFQSIYTDAKITARYTSEDSVFKLLLADSVRCIVVNRELNDYEKQQFEQLKITPRVTCVAIDALALIAHPSFPDSVVLYQQLGKWLGDTIHQKLALTGGTYSLVFDNERSANVRMIRELFKTGNRLPAYCYALNTNHEVIDYVSQHPKSIGLIGVNWLTNHDSVTQSFTNRVKILHVGTKVNTDGQGTSYQPYQAFIADKSYPLTRKVYVISREARSGLATGFSAFIAGDKGQRVVLKAGLVPATMPVRIIGITNND